MLLSQFHRQENRDEQGQAGVREAQNSSPSFSSSSPALGHFFLVLAVLCWGIILHVRLKNIYFFQHWCQRLIFTFSPMNMHCMCVHIPLCKWVCMLIWKSEDNLSERGPSCPSCLRQALLIVFFFNCICQANGPVGIRSLFRLYFPSYHRTLGQVFVLLFGLFWKMYRFKLKSSQSYGKCFSTWSHLTGCPSNLNWKWTLFWG